MRDQLINQKADCPAQQGRHIKAIGVPVLALRPENFFDAYPAASDKKIIGQDDAEQRYKHGPD